MSALAQELPDTRLVVAVVAHGGRLHAVLREYLSGPGRSQFVISHVGRAQALIADFDNEPSRAELLRFLMMSQGPAIVLAQQDPGLPHTVWVPKPVEYEVLLAASARIWDMLGDTPTLAQPRAALAAASQPDLKLLAPPQRIAGLPAGKQRLPGRALMGPFTVASNEGWSARIACLAAGVLGIAALATVMGWRPAEQSFRPATLRVETLSASSPDDPVKLRRAVDQALRAAPPLGAAQRNALEGELDDYRRLSSLQPEAAALTKLAMVSEWPAVSRRALPLSLMAPAGNPSSAEAQARRQLEQAVQLSLEMGSADPAR